MKVSRPLSLTVPASGVLFAKSSHEADFHMDEHPDTFHKLVCVLKGSVALRQPHHPAQPAAVGSIIAVPCGLPHHFEDLEPATLLLVCLSNAFITADAELTKLWGALAQTPKRKLQPDRRTRQRIEVLCRRALLEQQHARLGSTICVRTAAMQVLVLLARLPPLHAASSSEGRIKAVAHEVAKTFHEDWSLDRAAARAGLSRRRFTQLFQAATGRTFYKHLTDLRLTHAARLLKIGEQSVFSVMYSCGFEDMSHFYRMFGARFGMPPKAWAERHH